MEGRHEGKLQTKDEGIKGQKKRKVWKSGLERKQGRKKKQNS